MQSAVTNVIDNEVRKITSVIAMIRPNITTETAAASPMLKYWSPYFSTSRPGIRVELGGPPGP